MLRARTFCVVLALGALSSCAATGEPEPPVFFPPLPAEPRVQFLTSFATSHDVEGEPTTLERFALGKRSIDVRRIVKPYGVAVRDGVVYVCDSKALNITRLDFKNATYRVFGAGRLKKPINIDIDELGYKFVPDPVLQQVLVFDPQDRFQAAYDVPKPCRPVDVAVRGRELYVLDNDRECQIVVMDRLNGAVIRTFGSTGSAAGQFAFPNSLCISPDGHLYVSDTLHCRIQKLTLQGEPVWMQGGRGLRLSQFTRPRGIRVGPDGTIFVVEGAQQLVKLYRDDGQLLMQFGLTQGRGRLELPSQVWPDKTSIPYFRKFAHPDFQIDYLLFVASQVGPNPISVYAFGRFPEGHEYRQQQLPALPETPKDPAPKPAAGP